MLMVAAASLPSASMVMRDWRPVRLSSVTLLKSLLLNGMPVSAVLMSDASARLRNTVSAARKPPGVMLMPL